MSEDAPRNEFDPQWGGPNPSTADDLAWWELTSMCGGCGSATCHDGPCSERPAVDPFYGYKRLLCDRCPARQAQGFFPPVAEFSVVSSRDTEREQT